MNTITYFKILLRILAGTAEYHGWRIEWETDPWCRKYGMNYTIYSVMNDLYTHGIRRHTSTIKEALSTIDNLNAELGIFV